MVILDDGIVDNVPLKEVDEFGNPIYRLIYHDSKLSKDAPWTPNQRSEIIDIFKNDASKPYLEFEVRNDKNFFGRRSNITTGSRVRIYREDVFKSFKENGVVKTVKVF